MGNRLAALPFHDPDEPDPVDTLNGLVMTIFVLPLLAGSMINGLYEAPVAPVEPVSP